MKLEEQDRTALAAFVSVLFSTVLISPLIRPGWVAATVFSVVTVMLVGVVGRRLTTMWAWVVVGQLFALFVVLVLWAGGIPGPGGVDLLGTLMKQGLQVTHDQTPPVEAAAGVVLLAAGGFGLMALAVDLLSGPLRSPALAGLPLLATYALALGLVPGGVEWWRFALPAVGYLALLAAGSGRVTRSWGRPLRAPESGPSSGTALLGRDGRRVGAAAIALALVVPPLIPQFGSGLLLNGSGGGGDGDGSRVSVLNPILDLRENLSSQSDTTLFRYQTNDASPPPIRVVADEVFDGSTWSPKRTTLRSDNRVQDGLSDPPGLDPSITDSRQVQMTLQVAGLKQAYLPSPYPAQKVQADGTWLYDPETLNMYGVKTDTEDRTFRITYLDVLPSASGLAQSGDAPINMPGVYLETPEDLPPVVEATARDVVGNATDDYARAAALQAWFRNPGNFTYSVTAPRVDDNDSSSASIVAFLRDRQGYCVHFASTMAVMARTLGIPARVAVGFLPGQQVGEGVWEVSAKDAHAWPELYFEGAGWVRFEPTPSVRTGEAPSYSIPAGGNSTDPSASASATSTAAPSAGTSASATSTSAADEQADQQTATASGVDIPWTAVLVILGVLVLLSAPALTVAFLRRRRYSRSARDPALLASVAWADLHERLADLGVPPDPSATPRTVQSRLTDGFRLGGSERAALGRLVGDLENALFAAPGSAGDSRSVASTSADVETVASGVAVTRSRVLRWRARLFPASGLAMLLGAAGRADAAAGHAVEEVRQKVTHHQ